MKQKSSTSKDMEARSSVQDEQTEQKQHGTSQVSKKIKEDLAAANEKYLRLYSEFENFRRRVAKEKLVLIETAGEAILKELLPIVDDFDRALLVFQASDTQHQAVQEGIRLIHDKLLRLLRQQGVQEMLLEKGAAFDVEFHEAVTQLTTDDQKMRGKVLEVIERGYLLKNKVLRFAKVVIGA